MRILLTIALLVCSAVLGDAATRYVDGATGNNENTGADWDHAWAQMVKAEASSSPGDTVRVKSGTYVEPSTAGGASGNITFVKAIQWLADDGSGNLGSVVIRRASGTIAAQFNAAAATSWTGFTFDGEGTAAYACIGQGPPESNKAWTNCVFRDAVASGTGQLLRFYDNAGSLSVNNFIVNCSFMGTGVHGVYSDRADVILTNATFAMTSSGALCAGVSDGRATIKMSGGTLTLTGSQKFITADTTYAEITLDGVTIRSDSTQALIPGAGHTPLTLTNCNTTLAAPIFYTTTGTGLWQVVNCSLTLSNTSTVNGLYRRFSDMTDCQPTVISNNVISLPTSISDNYYGAAFHLGAVKGRFLVASNQVHYGPGSVISGSCFYARNVTEPTFIGNVITNLYSTNSPALDVESTSVTTSYTGTAYIGHNTVVTTNVANYVIRLGSEQPGTANVNCDRFNGSVVEYNRIYGPVYLGGPNTGVTTHAIFVGHQKECHVRYNLVWGSGYGAVIKGSPEDWNYQGGVYENVMVANAAVAGPYCKGAKNVRIFNNTIIEDPVKRAGTIVQANDNAAGQDSSGLRFFNNIVVAVASDALIWVDANAEVGLTASNNMYWNYEGNPAAQRFGWNGSMTGFSEWTSISGDTSVFADPKFTSNPSNLRMMWTSPCINRGDASGLSVDFDGNPIVSIPDIGAYEYQSKVAPIRIGLHTISVP